jgi:hypothetical protein
MQVSKKIRLLMANVAESDYLLDTLSLWDSCVFAFSPYKRLSKNFSGNLVNIRRGSDNATQAFGYDSNGDIDTSAIESWLAGADGFVVSVANQVNESYPIYQDDTTKQPKIATSGTVLTDGILFDGSVTALIIDDYAALRMTEPPISIYGTYKRESSHVGFVFCRNNVGSDDAQYSILNDGTKVSAWWDGNERLINDNQESNNDLIVWDSILADGLKMNTNGNESSGLFNTTLTDVANTTIGARRNPTSFSTVFNGAGKTILVFNADVYSSYADLVAGNI